VLESERPKKRPPDVSRKCVTSSCLVSPYVRADPRIELSSNFSTPKNALVVLSDHKPQQSPPVDLHKTAPIGVCYGVTSQFSLTILGGAVKVAS